MTATARPPRPDPAPPDEGASPLPPTQPTGPPNRPRPDRDTPARPGIPVLRGRGRARAREAPGAPWWTPGEVGATAGPPASSLV
jgi:hypothetical protein